MGIPRLNAADTPEQWIVLARSAVAINCPVDTSEDVLVSVSIPANAMGPRGALRVWSFWSMTNNANVKQLILRWNGPGGVIFMNVSGANSLTTNEMRQVQNRNATNSQLLNASGNASLGLQSNALVLGAVDTTQATSIVIAAQKATAGDVVTLESYLVELLQGA